MRILFVIVCSVTIVLLLFANRPETQAQLRELPPARVKTGTITVMDIQPMTDITGKLQPARKARLTFEVAGQLKHRWIEPGQIVEQNAVLLNIDEGDFTDAVSEKRALLKQEQDAIKRDRRLLELLVKERQIQEREVVRLEKLGQESLASRSRYDETLQQLIKLQAEEARMRHSVDSATARMMIQQSELNKAQRNLERTRLVAPFQGVVDSVYVEVGDYVIPGQVAVELLQRTKLDLLLEIPSHVAVNLELGQWIDVEIGLINTKGEIVALGVEPDPDTNTHSLRIRLDGEGLYPGQLARAHLPGKRFQDVNVIPVSAILYEEGEAYIYRIEKHQLVKTPVTLVQRYNDLYIVDGVDPFSNIVIQDVTSLADRQTVTFD